MGFLGGFFKAIFGGGGGANRRIDVSKGSAADGLPIIYGQRKVEPINVLKVVSRDNAPVTVTNFDHKYDPHPSHDYEEVRKKYDWLHRVDVWGQGEITSIERYWLDGESYKATRFNARPYFRAVSYYGKQGQGACSDIVKAEKKWSNNHKGQGVAYSYNRFFNSKKKPQFTSDPRCEAEIKGLKLWDPRDNTTKFSRNRALVLLDYLTASYGLNASIGEIHIDSFKLAADKCDELMDIPEVITNTTGQDLEEWDIRGGLFVITLPGAPHTNYRPDQDTVTNKQARWECDAILDPKVGVIENTKKLLEGVGWSLPWSNGQHKLILEDAVSAPVAHYGADDIIGGWTIHRGIREKRLNRITLEFPNANKDYEDDTVSWPALDSSEYANYLAEDNGQELHTTIKVETVTDFYRAQEYAKYRVLKSRIELMIESVKLAPHAMFLEPGDVITLTDEKEGFNARWFLVEKITVTSTLDVTAKLLDYDATVYGLPDPDREPLNNIGSNPDLRQEPPAVANLQLSEVHETTYAGITLSSIQVTWDEPEGINSIEEVLVSWKLNNEPEYVKVMRLPEDRTGAFISGLLDDKTYDVKVEYINRIGITSAAATERIDLAAQEGQLPFISGDGAPDSSKGQIGWRYVNMASGAGNGDVYEKVSASSWSLIGNIRGNDGDNYHSGAQDPNSFNVPNASLGDMYFQDNGDLYQMIAEDPDVWDHRTNLKGEKGDIGDPGPDGVAGAPGANGQTLYLWIAYASNSTGTQGFTTGTPNSSHSYFGTAPNKTTPSEGTNPSAYTWKKLPSGMTEQEIVDSLGWQDNEVDTPFIKSNAVSSTGYSSSSYTPMHLATLNAWYDRGQVSISTYDTQTDQLILTVTFEYVVSVGKVNFEVALDYGSSTRVIGFFTDQRHTDVSTVDKYGQASFTTRFIGGSISPPYQCKFKASYISPGAAGYIRNVTMTALVLKR